LEAKCSSAGMKEMAPKGNSESFWGFHIRSFWKIHFINPPEEKGKSLSQSFIGGPIAMVKYQNLLFGSIGK
jgi:hypothetical protein